MSEEQTGDLGERLPAPVRLRSAGVGVVAAGPVLAVLSLVLSLGPAAGVLAAAAVVGAVWFRSDATIVQLCVGLGAIGVIGLLEVYTGAGLGLEALQLATVAVVLGLVDVLLGTVIFDFHSSSEE